VTHDLIELEGENAFWAECVVLGSHRDRKSWSPCILILCKDRPSKKRIGKLFKKEPWASRLKQSSLRVKAVINKGLRLLASRHLTKTSVLSRSSIPTLPIGVSVYRSEDHDSLCGACIVHLDSSQIDDKAGSHDTLQESWKVRHVATLGGLILLRGHLYGITVAHPFVPLPHEAGSGHHNKLSPTSSDLDEDTFSDEEDSGSDVSIQSNEALPDKITNILHPEPTANVPALSMSTASMAALTLEDDVITDSAVFPDSLDMETDTTYRRDWALLKVDPTVLAPNLFVQPETSKACLIQGIEYDDRLSAGPVWVIAGQIGVQSGMLSETSAPLIIGRIHFRARRIHLQKHLGKVTLSLCRGLVSPGLISPHHTLLIFTAFSTRRLRSLGRSRWQGLWSHYCWKWPAPLGVYAPHAASSRGHISKLRS
jgi:hypothetical protein